MNVFNSLNTLLEEEKISRFIYFFFSFFFFFSLFFSGRCVWMALLFGSLAQKVHLLRGFECSIKLKAAEWSWGAAESTARRAIAKKKKAASELPRDIRAPRWLLQSFPKNQSHRIMCHHPSLVLIYSHWLIVHLSKFFLSLQKKKETIYPLNKIHGEKKIKITNDMTQFNHH